MRDRGWYKWFLIDFLPWILIYSDPPFVECRANGKIPQHNKYMCIEQCVSRSDQRRMNRWMAHGGIFNEVVYDGMTYFERLWWNHDNQNWRLRRWNEQSELWTCRAVDCEGFQHRWNDDQTFERFLRGSSCFDTEADSPLFAANFKTPTQIY